jgi:hypothetical protein
MTDRTQDPVTLDELRSLARAGGYAFSVDRLAAILPELQRLHDLARRLRALPLGDEVPAVRYTPE